MACTKEWACPRDIEKEKGRRRESPEGDCQDSRHIGSGYAGSQRPMPAAQQQRAPVSAGWARGRGSCRVQGACEVQAGWQATQPRCRPG